MGENYTRQAAKGDAEVRPRITELNSSEIPDGNTRRRSPKLTASGRRTALASRRLSPMEPQGLTKEELARLLREAQDAHAAYEKELGERDADWPSWYAQYILDKLRGRAAGPGP